MVLLGFPKSVLKISLFITIPPPPPVFTLMLLPTGGGCPLRRRPPADSQGGGIIHSFKILYMTHGLFLFVEPTGGSYTVFAGNVDQRRFVAEYVGSSKLVVSVVELVCCAPKGN